MFHLEDETEVISVKFLHISNEICSINFYSHSLMPSIIFYFINKWSEQNEKLESGGM